MATTIQISENLQEELTKKKLYGRETHEETLWNLIEDTTELSQETKKEMAEARQEIKAGNAHSLSSVKKKLRL